MQYLDKFYCRKVEADLLNLTSDDIKKSGLEDAVKVITSNNSHLFRVEELYGNEDFLFENAKVGDIVYDESVEEMFIISNIFPEEDIRVITLNYLYGKYIGYVEYRNGDWQDQYGFEADSVAQKSDLPQTISLGQDELREDQGTNTAYCTFSLTDYQRAKLLNSSIIILTLTGGSAFFLNSPLLSTGNGVRAVGDFIDNSQGGKTTRVKLRLISIDSTYTLRAEFGSEYHLDTSNPPIAYVYALKL